MKRRCTTLGSCLLVLAFSFSALAQEDESGETKQEETQQGEEESSPDTNDLPSDEDILKSTTPESPSPALSTTPATPEGQGWKNIVVVPRKPFLKNHRIELNPFWGISLNDTLIQHYSIGGEVNYFLTDILSVGLAGMYYFNNILDEEFWVRYHFNRIPSLNNYIYSAWLNFAYVPIYGKFAFFNKNIINFETYITLGAGFTSTEIIPRNYEYEAFTNSCLTFPVGAGVRFFLNRWLAFHISYKTFFLLDKFEPQQRGVIVNGLDEVESAKNRAPTELVYNMMFNVGFSFFFPMDFKYSTFR